MKKKSILTIDQKNELLHIMLSDGFNALIKYIEQELDEIIDVADEANYLASQTEKKKK